MSNRINWILHTSGSDTNGGGYTDEYAGTWSDVLNSGSAVDAITGGTTSDNGGGKVRITKAGQFDGAAVGMIAYFSATNYTAGHYIVIAVDASDNYVDLNCAYVDAQTDAVVNVGGALATLQTALDLCQHQEGIVSGGSFSVTDVDGGTSTSKRMKISNTGLFATYHDNTVAYYPHAEDGFVYVDFASGGSDGHQRVYAMDDNSVTIERPYAASTITSVRILPAPDQILVCPGTYSMYSTTGQYGAASYTTANTDTLLRPRYIIYGVNAATGAELGDADTWPVFQAVDKANAFTGTSGAISNSGGKIKITFSAPPVNPQTAGVAAGDWVFIDWSGTGSAPYVDNRFQVLSCDTNSITLTVDYIDPSGKTVTALYWGNWDGAGTKGESAILALQPQATTTYYSDSRIQHITVDGNGKSKHGIYNGRSTSNANGLGLLSVEAKNCSGSGIVITAYSSSLENWRAINVICHDCGYGLYLARPMNQHFSRFYANTYGVYDAGSGSYYTNCLFYGNSRGYTIINTTFAAVMNNCTFCENTEADLYWNDMAYVGRWNHVRDCLFYNTTGDHVYTQATFSGTTGTFYDCCFNLTGSDRFSSQMASVEINCHTLTESPFVSISGDSSTWDLRLNPQSADIDMLMDPTTGRICGALGFKELDLPALDAILTTDTLMGDAGHYLAPATSIVKDGELFGVDGAEEGEYVGGGGGGGLLQGNKRGNKQ